MSWKNLSIKVKIVIPLLIILALVIVLSVQQIIALKSVSNDFYRIQKSYTPALNLTLNADRDLYQAQLAERTMALQGANSQLRSSFDENVQQVEDRIGQVAQLAINDNIRSMSRDFLSQLSQWKNASRNMLNDLRSNKISLSAAAELSQGSLNDQFERMREVLDSIGERIIATSEQLTEDVNATSDRAELTLLILAVMTSLIVVAIIFLFPPTITRRIELFNHAINELAAGEGDLTARLPDLGEDEIGQVSRELNRFLSTLHSIVTNIINTANQVEQASSALTAIAGDNKVSSEQQAEAVSLVATAVTQMSSAIGEVASNSTAVANETGEADQSAVNVADIFSASIRDISELATNVNQSAEVMSRLEQEASDIVMVLDVIKGIAEQTNLLALNAAIEAARAGEQGRGFAVVADEVRTLASRTQESTEQINQIIDRLHGGVNEAVTIMTQSKERSKGTVDSATHAQSKLSEITRYLSSINERILQVATAVEQQSTVIDDISQNVERINVSSRATSERGRDVEAACSRLATLSTDLKQEVASFKV
ncbi:MAG: methyl-accepting chemotaxis protein [Gammaproteobacteria bacterium]|nr:methyl-accepting chemotaxis protein [Gammaproteobacteria bacterium]